METENDSHPSSELHDKDERQREILKAEVDDDVPKRLGPHTPSDMGSNSSNSAHTSESEDDDIGVLHFKLGTSDDPASTNPLLFLFDWESMKGALMAAAKASLKPTDMIELRTLSQTEPTDTGFEETLERQATESQSSHDESYASWSSNGEGGPQDAISLPQDCEIESQNEAYQQSSASDLSSEISMADVENPAAALYKILQMPSFDLLHPIMKEYELRDILTLTQLKSRSNNEIEIEIKKRNIREYSTIQKNRLCPFKDFSNILVKHSKNEFITFCTCDRCLEYREVVIRIIGNECKVTIMLTFLADILSKAYTPFLKKENAWRHYHKLLSEEKNIYWITCVNQSPKKATMLNAIYEGSLSDNMILVLFSSILMLHNPLQLLVNLSFHIECMVKAYLGCMPEIAEVDNKIPAEVMINYVIDGYEEICRLSEHLSQFLFAFENDFMRKFKLTWTLLCQRLYRQHVYLEMADTMLACLVTLKDENLTSQNTALIKKYIQFDDKMMRLEMRWTEVWIELNKYCFSEAERKRTDCLMYVWKTLQTIVHDATAFNVCENLGGQYEFYEVVALGDRRKAWFNALSWTKRKYSEGYFSTSNTVANHETCKKCNNPLDYHDMKCNCLACSIAGGPNAPKNAPTDEMICTKCMSYTRVEQSSTLYDPKFLNLCACEVFQGLVKNYVKSKKASPQSNDDASSFMLVDEKTGDSNSDGVYHIACAVFHHLKYRKPYKHPTIEEKYFCSNCRLVACLLARKILNNEIDRNLSLLLIQYYQPLSLSRENVRCLVQNVMQYNRKLITKTVEEPYNYEIITKIYWTFVLSLYGTYFMEFSANGPPNMDMLRLVDDDIAPCLDSLKGNLDDDKFHVFLDKLKSFGPLKNSRPNTNPSTVAHEGHMKNPDNTLKEPEKPPSFSSLKKNQPQAPSGGAAGVPTPAIDSQSKRNAEREKAKKYLSEHCKDGHHSNKKRVKKECNHIRMNETRDRLRKKLNQLISARKGSTNGSKELAAATAQGQTSSSANAPTQANTTGHAPATGPPPAAAQQKPRNHQQHPYHSHSQQQQSPHHQSLPAHHRHHSQQQQQQKPQPRQKTQLHHNNYKHQHQQQQNAMPPSQFQTLTPSSTPLAKKTRTPTPIPFRLKDSPSTSSSSALPQNTARTASTQTAKSETNLDAFDFCVPPSSKRSLLDSQEEHIRGNYVPPPPSQAQPKAQPQPPAPTTANKTQTATTTERQKANHDDKRERCEPTNNNNNVNTLNNNNNNNTNSTKCPQDTATAAPSKAATEPATTAKMENVEQLKETATITTDPPKDEKQVQKWIHEKLNFIEGKGSKQPQAVNPKKAAKKAKQKMRKEEEKRIAELVDYRCQFYDIYFKEFAEKQHLKQLKSSKKRDKRKVADLEANVKKLQRAKAKIETAILELIATVKQTNTEFKFAYLPTKEQQQEKLRAMEMAVSHPCEGGLRGGEPVQPPPQYCSEPPAADHKTTTIKRSLSAANMPHTTAYDYDMAYDGCGRSNHFPYPLEYAVPSGAALGAEYGSNGSPLPAQTCYAPPGALGPVINPPLMGLMAGVSGTQAPGNAHIDPSKRIVTIRRINLPNVPEPQVTVTAKGSSPDKDKLLYTFVNGQLVQTGVSAGPPSPSLPTLPNRMDPQEREGIPDGIMDIPPPQPPAQPTLTKNQLKKERKRQAMQAILGKDAFQFLDPKKVSKVVVAKNTLRFLEAEKAKAAAAMSTATATAMAKPNEKKKKQKNALSAPTANSATLAKTKQKNSAAATPLPLSTASSASTIDYPTQNPKTKKKTRLPTVSVQSSTSSSSVPSTVEVRRRRRSPSMTRSSSAATSVASGPIRHCRPRPHDDTVGARGDESKGHPKNKQPEVNSGSGKKKSKNKPAGLKQQQQMPPLTPTPTTTPQQKGKQQSQSQSQKSVKKQQQQQQKAQTKPQQQQSKTPANKKQNNATPATSNSQKAVSEEKTEAVLTLMTKKEGLNRQRLIDSGQFDNNPFKSLNEHDSESDEWDDSSRSSNCGDEIAEERIDAAPVTPLELPSEEKQPDPQIVGKNKRQGKMKSHSQEQRAATGGGGGGSGSVSGKGKDDVTDSTSSQSRSKNSKGKKPEPQKPPPPTTKQKQQKSLSPPQSQPQSQRGCRNDNNPTSARSKQSDCVELQSHSSGHSLHQHYQQQEPEIKVLSKRSQKQAQRNQRSLRQQAPPSSNAAGAKDLCVGIPNHMGYFNPHEAMHQQDQKQQQEAHNSFTLAQQMQGLSIAGNSPTSDYHRAGTGSVTSGQKSASNISIMDQLNRGVQVENLSLPPGITLTKVDPAKSEQLRQKSESIKKLAKPLQAAPPASQTFSHPGTTIIAPPVGMMPSYYGAPYAGVAAAGAMAPGGFIMLESSQATLEKPAISAPVPMPVPVPDVRLCAEKATSKKSKKRRNKTKSQGNDLSARSKTSRSSVATVQSGALDDGTAIPRGNASNRAGGAGGVEQPKMITLRNPMFHGAPGLATGSVLQSPHAPSGLTGHPLVTGTGTTGMPMAAAAPIPMDQPAAIIKNENGMFTIRNPALHQAVTNGLAMGGYRQFGNINYYTPQEAAAEAARAMQAKKSVEVTPPTTSFSYFSTQPTMVSQPAAVIANSSSTGGAGNTHNTISISCTSVDHNTSDSGLGVSGGGGGGNGNGLRDNGDAIISHSPSSQKCLSAIGSEMKQRSKENNQHQQPHWFNFGQDYSGGTISLKNAAEGAMNSREATYMGACGGGGGGGVQDNFHHSSFYNGFDVFSANSPCGRSSATGSIFDSGGSDCLRHHSCGDDSPPPTITGYNRYLEGIPNTGVIRYDDATFLRNLIPGQNLNNEVSIHNINDANFGPNAASPAPHRVDITPVMGGNRAQRPTTKSLFDRGTTSTTSYHESLVDFTRDDASSLFSTSGARGKAASGDRDLNRSPAAAATAFKPFGPYEYEPSLKENSKSILDFNDILTKSPASQRTSPYLDESSLDTLMNSLKISAHPQTTADEQFNQLNGNKGGDGVRQKSSSKRGGDGSGGSSNVGGASIGNSNGGNAANGWW